MNMPRPTPRSWRTTTLLVVAAVLAPGLLAEPAAARIHPFTGIARVRLGMTTDQVRHANGKPGRGSSRYVYQYAHGSLVVVVFDGASGLVSSVSTTSRHERISRAVGVGAKKSVVRRRYPTLTCTGSGAFGCKVVDPASQHKMVFSFFRGRLNEITVDALPY